MADDRPPVSIPFDATIMYGARRARSACDSWTFWTTCWSGSRAASRSPREARRSPRRTPRDGAGRCRAPRLAIGESRYSGSCGIRPRSRSRSSSHTISWVRPIANDGMSSTPFACARRRGRPRRAWRSPRPRPRAPGRRRSTRRATIVGLASTAVGSRRIGVPGRPRSPENDDHRVAAAVGRLERASRTIAEPRMCPASSSVTWTPWAASCSRRTGSAGTAAGWRRRRPRCTAGRRGSTIDLGPAARSSSSGSGPPGGLGALRGQLDRVVEHVLVARSRSSSAARSGSRRSRRASPLRELLLELRRVQEDEPRELGRGGGAHDRPRKPLRDEQRQQAAVVEVGVGEDDRVERRGSKPSGTRLRIEPPARPGTSRSR